MDDQFTDRLVQRLQREEAPVTQPRQDPALHHLHADFDLGLVRGLYGRAGMIAVR